MKKETFSVFLCSSALSMFKAFKLSRLNDEFFRFSKQSPAR